MEGGVNTQAGFTIEGIGYMLNMLIGTGFHMTNHKQIYV